MNTVLAVAIRLVVSSVFLFAGVGKMRSTTTFRHGLRLLLPELTRATLLGRDAILSRLFGGFEILLGMLLLSGLYSPLPELVGLGLVAGFTGLLIRAGARGIRGPCGCGTGKRIGVTSILTNLAVITLLALMLVEPVPSILRAPSAAFLTPQAMLLAGMGLLAVVMSTRPRSPKTGGTFSIRGIDPQDRRGANTVALAAPPGWIAPARRAPDPDRPRKPPYRSPPEIVPCAEVVTVTRPAPKHREPDAGISADPFVESERRQSITGAFRISPGHHLGSNELLAAHRDRFGLGPHDELQSTDDVDGVDEGIVYRHFRHQHDGYEVFGSKVVLMLWDGRVVRGLGRRVPKIDQRARVQVPESEAVETVRHLVAAKPPVDAQLVPVTSRVLFVRPNQGSVPEESYRLAYRCVASNPKALTSFTVDVDAIDARVLNVFRNTVEAWQPATLTGKSLYDGEITADGEYDPSTGLARLSSPQVSTKTCLGQTEISQAFDLTAEGTEIPFDPDSDLTAGFSAHWAAQRTLAYLSSSFGLSGADGSGLGITIYTRSLSPPPEMSMQIETDPALRVIKMPMAPDKPVPGIDQIAHEVGHFTERAFSGLVNIGESGALAEGIADIIAVLTDFHTVPEFADWTMFDDAVEEKYRRSFTAPETFQHPSYYGGPFWKNPAALEDDKGGIHWNCTVLDHWFYRLSEGGVPGLVPVGLQRSERLIRTLLLERLLAEESKFIDARSATDLAATHLFGEFSWAHESVLNAWHAVGVGPAISPYMFPAPDDSNVPCWPVHLEWQPGLAESAWQIDISADPSSFDAAITLAISGGDSSVAEASLDLSPSQTYFWRIVATASPAIEKLPRTVQAFTTASCKPVLLGPRGCGDGRIVHPWGCEFVWEPVPGATSYLVEIARDPHFRNTLFGTETATKPFLVRDLPMDIDFWWRVKAIRDILNASEWSVSHQIRTLVPKVELVKPLNWHKQHPWNITLEWKPVKGAREFRVEATTDHPELLTDYPELLIATAQPEVDILEDKTLDVTVAGDKHTARLDLPAKSGLGYDWQVRVFGPPPWNEEGDPSEPWYLVVDPSTTIAHQLTYTGNEGEGPASCVPMWITIPLEWQRVNDAVEYWIRIYEWIIPLGYSGAVLPGNLIYDQKIGATSGDIQQLQISHPATSPTTGTPDANGYTWRVWAIGPNNLKGDYAEVGFYLLQPPAPSLVTPQVTQFKGEQITVAWYSPMAHSGGFVLEVYDSESCSDDDWIASEIIMGASPGVTKAVISDMAVGDYTWRVRPWTFVPCESSFNHWSECGGITIVKKPADIKPDGPCDELVKYGTNLPIAYSVDIDKSTGNIVFEYDALCIPDRFVVTYETHVLFNKCVTGKDQVILTLPGGSTTIVTVTVIPDCDPLYQLLAGCTGVTEWNFKVHCGST